MSSKRRCGNCRQVGHDRRTCPDLTGRRPLSAEEHAVEICAEVQSAIFAYSESLPRSLQPSEETLALALVEHALGTLVEVCESTALAWELILPRLAAFNSEWATDDRAELREIAEEHWEDDDEEEEDEDDDDPEDDDDDDPEDAGGERVEEDEEDEEDHGLFGGIQWGTVRGAEASCAYGQAKRSRFAEAYAYNTKQWNPFRSRPRPGFPGMN
jgi:hypothetical protein